MNWNGKKVLVAGGAGMIGSHMSRELLKRGAIVTIADSLLSGSVKNISDIIGDCQFSHVDLRNYHTCKNAVKGNDAVFQFAANMGGIGYITKIGAGIMIDNSLININMLTAAKQFDIQHYFFSSSACVYPEYLQKEAEVVPLKESDAFPALPDQFYGWEKLYCEKIVEACQRDYSMNIRLARFHNIYGSGYTCFDKERGKAPCHLILKAIKHPNPEFTLWGDGKATRSFMYVDDCIEAILRLMDSQFKEPLNIGSDRLITVDGLAKIVIDISGKSINPKHDLTKPQGVRGRNADLTLMRDVLNWQPQYSLEQGLALVYKWAEDNFSELEGIDENRCNRAR